MKKIITAILTVAMVGAMSVTSFAESQNGSDSKEVKATYSAADKTDVYSVDVTWGGLEFEYVQANQQWDTVNHKWGDAEGSTSEWRIKSDSDNKIRLKNNSSKTVDATFSFTPDSKFIGIEGHFIYNGKDLINPVTLEKPIADIEAVEYTVRFMPTGDLSDSITTESTIGKITVTIR